MSANKHSTAADLNKTNSQLIEELRNSQSLLQMVCDAIPMEIYVKDHEGRYLIVNKKAQTVSGLNADEFLGKTAIDAPYGTEDERAGLALDDRQVLKTGNDMHYPEQIVTNPDGQVIIRDVTKVPLKDDAGTVVGLVGTANDITQRKQAESALRESEARFRSMMDHSPYSIYLKDLEGRYTLVNRVFAERRGCTESEMIGKTIRDFFPNETAEAMADIEEEVLATRGVVQRQHEISFSDGSRQFVLTTKFPVYDHENRINGIGSIVIDTTERYRAEEALRESQELFRNVIDNSPSVIVLKDLEGRYTLANRVFAERRGISLEEIIGKRSADLFPQELADQFTAQNREVLETGSVVEREYVTQFPDSTLHTIMNTQFPVKGSDGRMIGVGTIARDITERKRAEEALRESEERFRSVIDNSPSGIHVKDLEGRYTLVNRWFAERQSCSPEEMIGKMSNDFFPAEFAELYNAQSQEVLETGNVVEREYTMPFPDGARRTTISTKFPITSGDGRIVGVGSISTDITKQRKVEEQLRESQKMEAVGQLAGGIAHEFNNNLQIIVNGVQLARDGTRDPRMVEKYLDMTLKSAERSAELTQQLLAYSRKTPLMPTAIDLNALIFDLTKLVRPIIGSDIEIRFDPAENLVPVIADDGMIKQSLINLCINARDAMPDGGRLIFETRNHHADQEFCDLHGCEQPGGYALISVSDSGVGMTTEIREHIFEPFFTTKEVGQGTGLGLAMVHGIVQQHDGVIEAFSKPGGGTTFNIYLPKADSPVAKEEISAAGDSPGGSETILVAEDEENVRDLLARMLENKGYQVLVAKDGEEAMAVFKANAHRVDLVILDMVMPKLRGHAVFEQIRDGGSDVPVLFSSGYSLDSSDADFTSGKGVHTIQKPYASDVLYTAVREALDQ